MNLMCYAPSIPKRLYASLAGLSHTLIQGEGGTYFYKGASSNMLWNATVGNVVTETVLSMYAPAVCFLNSEL